ncbi:MAG TPA: hypothetical protein VFN18_04145 [Solirubrobacterales bacterium]|nr:hypothetical protein [Solirubrobacterales bacterium]
MNGQGNSGVVIEGERFPFSDAVAFLMADDIVRGGLADLPSVEPATDLRTPEQLADEEARFAAISSVYARLEAVMGADGRVSWLVSPNQDLDGGRPLDFLAAGESAPVFRAVERIERAAARN